jgi:phytanoyl-CoA dioxygenase PhyH
MPSITTEDFRTFAEDGYIVVRQIVPHDLIETTRRAVAGEISKAPPPPSSRGPYFYFLTDIPPALLAALDDRVFPVAESLIAPARFERPGHVQISLNIPPWPHVPGGPHIDGLTPPEPDGQPATFTVLAGIFLTDQTRTEAGNLWVWPGTHWLVAAYLRERGPDVLIESAPYPPVDLGVPRQVTGRAGDVLLAHYLLGHNIGGNTTSTTREVLYFRLSRNEHRTRWRDAVQDPLLEFEPVRALIER